MRLLVLDGSKVLESLVRRLAPDDVEVETAATFDDGLSLLESRPPDALIVDVTPAQLPWDRLRAVCQEHDPPIPVLYESCVYRDPAEAGIGELDDRCAFIAKPYHLPELRHQIQRLVLLAQAGRATDH